MGTFGQPTLKDQHLLTQNLSRRAQERQVFPYLLPGLQIVRPNQVWGIDITYLRLPGRADLSGGGAGLALALRGQLGVK